MLRFPIVVLVLAGLVLAGCGIPRDPHHTLQRVQGDTLRVGVTEAPPFIVRDGAEAAGVEAALIRAFADSLGATVRWFWGPADPHMEALERYELDLVAGGLTMASPWKTHVALTRPYYTAHEAIGSASGMTPRSWDGVPVAVPAGGALAAFVADLGAEAVAVPEVAAYDGYVAATEWELRAWGRSSVRRLRPVKHVLAVPPGENGWLFALEGFAQSWQRPVHAALIHAARR